MSTEAEIKTIVGKCVEIEQKPGNDWVRFNIDVGSQYPVGLSTKLPDMIEAGRAVGGDTATWTFKQSDGKENPNKPGTYYVNRYLSKVEAGEHAPAPTAGGAAPVQTTLPVETQETVDWDAKERRDYRSRAWAQTLGAFSHTIRVDEDPKEVWRRLLPFQQLVYADVVRDLALTDDSEDLPF